MGHSRIMNLERSQAMAKVAINGMGRIGRAALKIIMEHSEFELVAVNDLMDLDNLVYLLNYDTVYGRYKHRVKMSGDALEVAGRTVKYLSVKDPAQLPWKDLGVKIVFESTGLFTQAEGLQKHLAAGAEYALLSAPPKGADVCCMCTASPARGRAPDLLRLLHQCILPRWWRSWDSASASRRP
jgi:glyceraldehyde 3-phosphate dehydrogenase